MNLHKLSRLTVLASLIFTLTLTEAVAALSNTFPDPGVDPYGTGGNVPNMSDARAVVARRGGSYQLDSPEAAFKVFSYTSNVQITFQEACNATQWGDWRTRFEVFIMSSHSSEDRALDSTPEWTFDTNNCGGSNNITTPTISGLNRSGKPGHEDWYLLLVKANHIGSGGGINGFRVRTSSGFVTFRDLPDSQRGSWSDESVAPYKAFAMLDSVFTGNSRDQDSFEFRFGPDCGWQDGRTAYLKWFDADYGAGNEQNGISFTLYERRAGASGWSPILSRSNSQLGGDNQFRQAGFSARKNAKYRWVWANVDNANGIQFWAPFSEIDFNFDCEPEGRVTTINCNVVRGWAYEPGDPSRKLTVRIWIRLSGGSVRSYDVVANDSTPDPPDFSSYSNGFNWSVPSAYKSDTNYTVMSVDVLYPTGNIRIYSGWESRDNSGSPEPCLDPGTWDYRPQQPTGNPTDSSTRPKPGDTLNIRGVIDNSRGTRYAGPDYTHRLQVRRGSGSWSNFYNGVAPGIAAGGSRARSANYRIPNNATHGEQFCFRTGVAAYNGNGVAGTITSAGFSTNINGPRYSPILCYTVYNLRFDLNNEPTLPGFEGVSMAPGLSHNFNWTVTNQDSSELNANFPNASPGQAPSVRVRAQITTGNASISGAGTDESGPIPWGGFLEGPITIRPDDDTQVGEQVCVRVFTNKEQGYSDNTSLANDPPVDKTFCTVVHDGPYLQVYGNDVWSGGQFDTSQAGDSCAPPDSSGNIISHVRSTVGAMSEYAAYAWGVVEQFGTASVPNGNSLTFANIPSNGDFKEERCLRKIFDGGGAGGTINNALWDSDATQDITQGSSTNLNNITNGQNGAGQFSVSGDAHLSNPWPNMRNSKTFLINGNLNLTSNISSFSNGWSEGQVPVVVFIVTGDIYIGPGVSRLDGIFVANGTISTCAPQGSESAFNQFLAVGQACDTHLEINGQLIANNIAFRRVKGGTNEAATGTGANSRCVNGGFYDNLNRRCAAETIRFPAAFYLADIVLDYGSTGDPNNYPIQQIRDLPPIY